MALFRRLFYRKPPDRLLEISERVYVFDCCFSSEALEDNEYKDYLGAIVAQLQDYFPDASFMVCNFREGGKKSHISDILSEYDMTVMDYPRQYEGCPLLPLEMIHHFLRSSESWLSLEGQHNVLLMHCERGGWPVLAFMLAGLLLYRKQYNGEQKTLEMVYKQAPKELFHLFSPLNPQPSHLRYLQYITRRGSGSDWPPEDRPFMLECIILVHIPHFDSKGGCRPIVRVHGQDPLIPTDRSSKILLSTPRTKKRVQHYRQEESAPLKINARCHIRGDVVIECIHLDEDLEHEEVMFRIMFNTAFIESHKLLLNYEEIDSIWNAKDQFRRDFKAQVHFSDFDAAESERTLEAAVEEEDEETEGVSEEFFEAEEIFSTSEIHAETQILLKKGAVDTTGPDSEIHVITDKIVKKSESVTARTKSNNSSNERLNIINSTHVLFEPSVMVDQAVGMLVTSDSEHDVNEKLITLDNVIELEEKRMLESSSLLRKTEAISPTIEEDLTSQTGNSEPKTIHQSVISSFTQQKIALEDASDKLENLTPTNGRNIRKDNIVSKAIMESAFAKRSPSLKNSGQKSVVTKGVSILHGRDIGLSDLSTVDQTVDELDARDRKPDNKIMVKMNSDRNLETLYDVEHAISGSKITICDKTIITEKLIALNEMNVVKEDNETETGNFKQEIRLVVSPSILQKSTTDPIHLKCVAKRAFDQKVSEADTNGQPEAVIVDTEAMSVLDTSNSIKDLETDSIFNESIVADRNQNFSSSDATDKVMRMLATDRENDHCVSEIVVESKVINKKTRSFTQRQSNEKVLPPTSRKYPIQRRPPSDPAIGIQKSNQQQASNFLAKTANSKTVPRWISPKKASDATSAYMPSHPPSRYNSAPPALAIPSVHACDGGIQGAPSPSPSPFGGRNSAPSPPPPPGGSQGASSSTPQSPGGRVAASTPCSPGGSRGAPLSPSPPGGSQGVPLPPPPPGGSQGVPLPPPPPGGSRGAPLPPPPPGGCGGGPPPPPPPWGRGAPPAPPSSPNAPPPPPSRVSSSNSLVGGRGRVPSRPIGSSSLAPRKPSLKPLHWVKVTRAVQGSLWAELQKCEEALSASEFDASELEFLFSAAVPKSDDSSKYEGRRKSLGSKSDKVHLIELRRANNTEIMLTKVKMPLPDIMSAALALDDLVLDADQVENLIKFCPTKEEMELLKGYTGDKEKLGKCEQFFLELMKVPRVESKLRVFSFKIQFHQQIADLRKGLSIIDSASEQIRSSVKLKEIMKKILYLGNMLNQGTARGSAIGFRLDSLLKLTDTRATNNKMTLMHYLCQVLASRSPHLVDFHEDLTSLEAASKIQLKSLAEEMQAIVKGLEKVELELNASESDGPVSEVFRKTLKEFTAVAGADVQCLSSLYSAVGRNADALALYFGEDPARCPFEQVVSTLTNFVQMFRQAHLENCKQAELDKKKAKEAETEKSRAPNPTNKNAMRLSDQLQQSLKKSKAANQREDVR